MYIYTHYYVEVFLKIICILWKVVGNLNVTVLPHIRMDAKHIKMGTEEDEESFGSKRKRGVHINGHNNKCTCNCALAYLPPLLPMSWQLGFDENKWPLHTYHHPPIHTYQKETTKYKISFPWLLTTDCLSSWWMLCPCTLFHRLMACQHGTYHPHLLWTASLPTTIINIGGPLPGTYLEYTQLTRMNFTFENALWNSKQTQK